MSLTETVVETCAITWWRGYVRGRFQAVVPGDPPVLVAESAPLPGGDAPQDTPEARAAVDDLTGRLRDAGWEHLEDDDVPWHAPRFVRSAEIPARPRAEREDVPDLEEQHLVAQLHAELQHARAAAQARQAPVEPERHLRPVVSPPPAVEERSLKSRGSGLRMLALWVVLVACVAAAAAAISHSGYATAVAALTAAAIGLGVDSWRVARWVSRTR